MSARVGGHHKISFPILKDDRAQASTRIDADSENPLVILRQLWRDSLTVNEKIAELGMDDNGLHGDLQVLLSTLRRMQQKVERLIAQEEEFSG